MAIQYSGTNYAGTFTCTTGTRQEIVTGIQNGLVSCGWTIISGTGTGNVLLQSAETPSPQNLQMRVNAFDPGSGNCAQVILRNVAGTNIQTNYLPLLPAASKVFNIIGNPYQAFIFTASSPSTAREFVAFGVPYLPSFVQGVITECIWGVGNGNSDTDTTVHPTFRTALQCGTNGNFPSLFLDINGNLINEFNTNPNSNNYTGLPQLIVQVGSAFSANNSGSTFVYRWHDNSIPISEPLIAWGLTSVQDEGKIRGQLWDAAIFNDSMTADQLISFDSHNWWVVTSANNGTIGQFARGSLLIVTP